MVFWCVNMTDLEKRAEQIRKELSIEDKTNLVAKAIIELVKEKRTFIKLNEITDKIQDYFGFLHEKPYIIYYQGSSISEILCKIHGLCRDKRKPTLCAIRDLPKNKKFKADGKEENIYNYYKINTKERENLVSSVCNGDYDFLLKPIPILDKIKIEKNIDKETENIKDENEKKNTRELGKEQTVYARENFPLVEINKIYKRANNKCEFCECQTFEKKNGEMYFEIHHIVHYSDGGENSAQNCVLLCPNCHRKIHFAKEEIVNEMEITLKRKVEK